MTNKEKELLSGLQQVQYLNGLVKHDLIDVNIRLQNKDLNLIKNKRVKSVLLGRRAIASHLTTQFNKQIKHLEKEVSKFVKVEQQKQINSKIIK